MANQGFQGFTGPGSLSSSYEEYVNPQWVALLNILDMKFATSVAPAANFLPKMGAHPGLLSAIASNNTGHNHPYIVQALKDELDKNGPAMLQAMCRRSPENWRSDCANLRAAD